LRSSVTRSGFSCLGGVEEVCIVPLRDEFLFLLSEMRAALGAPSAEGSIQRGLRRRASSLIASVSALTAASPSVASSKKDINGLSASSLHHEKKIDT
jgi:hypothetical protein